MPILTYPHMPASDALPTSPQVVPVLWIFHPQQQTRTVPSIASSTAYSTFALDRRYHASYYTPDTRIDPVQALRPTVRPQLHHHQPYSALLPCVSRGRDSSDWMGECRQGRRGSRSLSALMRWVVRWQIGSFASEVGFRFRVFRYWSMDRRILSLSVIVLHRVELKYHMSLFEIPQPMPSSFLQTAIMWWCYRAHRNSQGVHPRTHHAWAYPAALQETG